VESTKNLPSRTNIILAFATTYIVWGSTYFFNKVVIQEIPPFLSATLRFVTAGVLIFIMTRLLNIPFKFTKAQFLNAGFAGFLFLTLGNGGVVWALQYVDSGFTALLVSAQPLVLILLIWIIDKKKISPRSLFGIFLGITGIYLLTSETKIVTSSEYFIGIAIIFCCLIVWAYGSIFVGKVDLPPNTFVNSAVQMIVGGVLMAPISLVMQEDWSLVNTASTNTWLSLGFLITFGSIAAFSSFNYLLKHVDPEKVTTNTYVNPVVALFLGNIFLKEPLTKQAILASCILLIGVFVINTRKIKKF
jgi:drug/metabolite transporter (DMT)-like permease